MINLTQDFGGIPVVWVRFNPDSYSDVSSKTIITKVTGKLPLLIQQLKLISQHKPKTLCSVVCMFYDGFDKNDIPI